MDDIVPDLDTSATATAKICPLLDRACLRDRCQLWVRDWHEERNRYHVDCAIALIAGVNDESLVRLRNKKTISRRTHSRRTAWLFMLVAVWSATALCPAHCAAVSATGAPKTGWPPRRCGRSTRTTRGMSGSVAPAGFRASTVASSSPTGTRRACSRMSLNPSAWTARVGSGPVRSGAHVYDAQQDRFIFRQDLGGRVRRFVTLRGELYLMAERAVYRLGPDDIWEAVGIPGVVDPLAALSTDGRALYVGHHHPPRVPHGSKATGGCSQLSPPWPPSTTCAPSKAATCGCVHHLWLIRFSGAAGAHQAQA